MNARASKLFFASMNRPATSEARSATSSNAANDAVTCASAIQIGMFGCVTTGVLSGATEPSAVHAAVTCAAVAPYQPPNAGPMFFTVEILRNGFVEPAPVMIIVGSM